MAGKLVRCAECARHVYADEAACPFCKASLGGGGHDVPAVVAISAPLSPAGGAPAAAPWESAKSAFGPYAPVALYGPPPLRSAKPPASRKPPAAADEEPPPRRSK
jgi:hypothetical protein